MPPKKKMAAPIDRPLSRAYLRKFTGWSTAFPPGASDPSSQRKMENLLINRDGSIRLRPGLEVVLTLPATQTMIGSYEPFYLNDGRKAYLFAVKDTTVNRVVFRIAIPVSALAWDINTLPAQGFDVSAWPAYGPSFSTGTTYVRYVQIDNKILALSNNGEPLIVFYVGATKKVPEYLAIADPAWPGSRGFIDMPSKDWVLGPQTSTPTHAVDFSSDNSIASAGPANNIYNVAFCYTFSNELGETAPSEIAQFRIRRAWGGWGWEVPDPATLGTQTTSPLANTYTTVAKDTSDQLSLIASGADMAGALAAGATKLNFYFMSWSTQDSVPVEMQLVGSRDLTPASTADSHGWFMMTPATLGLGTTIPIPTAGNRANLNTTEPPRCGQGIVASDRLVLVNDPTKAAVIRWTTNTPGDNLNLAASRGGGYKTLTSGNMQVAACVKLWQNPQSADTLTILNKGTDGLSTTYYMTPASVSSQSDNTIVMGFEETTNTPGTTSPYGCEVANNTLYHPLDDQLMKTSASNYNINHKSQTDMIANQWTKLINKDKIVSCFFDQRLYFLVHNPDGAALEVGCTGNEVWVLDLATTTPVWSRWLVQGSSLKKAETGSKVYLSIVKPGGIAVFDDSRGSDEQFGGSSSTIPWKMETNTQGANRAHDAWSHLQQANLVVGNFTGSLRYGIRGIDLHGRKIDKSKVLRSIPSSDDEGLPWDVEDYFLIQESLKEWHFYAESHKVSDVEQPFFGQLTLVQYRYAPISVNVGYEFGSVETFEYGREGLNFAGRTTDNGVPQPFIDTGRP